MNALAIIQHAYTSIAKSHPEKDALAILADVESIAARILAAAKSIETLTAPLAKTA